MSNEAFEDFLLNLDSDQDRQVSFKEYCEAELRFQRHNYDQSMQIG